MTFLTRGAAILATVFLSGCLEDGDTIPVNLDYAKTNFGYINSGDFKAGSFFIWNKAEGKMRHLSDIPGFTPPPNPRDKTSQTASYSSGASIDVEGNKALIQARANAMIAARSEFEIAYPNKVAYDDTITRITAYLGDNIAAGGSVMEEWGFREAVKDPNQFYVLVRKVTYGDSIKLLVDGKAEAGAGFSVVVKGADLNVKLNGRGVQSIQGTDTEVAIDVYVFRPKWSQTSGAQNPDFELKKWVDLDDLPDLFRTSL